MARGSGRPYSPEEKELVAYFREKLVAAGVDKFPRDWHLKQLATARAMLAAADGPGLEEWKACIDWAFSHPFWGDKVDHLARVQDLWVEYRLKRRRAAWRDDKYGDLYLS